MSALPRAFARSSSAIIMSCRCPAVSAMWIGRPFVSTTAWILVENPPRERPSALLMIPLFRPTHLDVRERRSHRRSSRSHRPRAAARGRSSPSAPLEPSSRSGCRRSSRVRSAPVSLAKEGRSSLERSRPPRRADHLVSPSALSPVEAKWAEVEPTARRLERAAACRSLITPAIAAQLPRAAICQVIEMIYVSGLTK